MNTERHAIGHASTLGDAIAFFEGTGIYHPPYCHQGRHYIVSEQFTDAELLAEMKQIHETSAPLESLEGRNDQIARYYFAGARKGFKQPLNVLVAEEEGTRVFYCKYMDGRMMRHSFPRSNAHRPSIASKACAITGCDHPAISEELTGLFSRMVLCAIHKNALSSYSDHIRIK